MYYFWLESVFRWIVRPPKKNIDGQIVLITGLLIFFCITGNNANITCRSFCNFWYMFLPFSSQGTEMDVICKLEGCKFFYFLYYPFNLRATYHTVGVGRMVNSRLCETARLRIPFFFVGPTHFDFLDCETEASNCLTPSYKKRDCVMHITAQKTRLRDPWNSTKILRDPEFLKNHSPPLTVVQYQRYLLHRVN